MQTPDFPAGLGGTSLAGSLIVMTDGKQGSARSQIQIEGQVRASR
jgi:hypothetical protein